MAIIDILLKNRDLFDLSKILIMAPKNAVNVWIEELNRWVPDDDLPRVIADLLLSTRCIVQNHQLIFYRFGTFTE